MSGREFLRTQADPLFDHVSAKAVADHPPGNLLSGVPSSVYADHEPLCDPYWTISAFIEESVAMEREQVGDKRVLLAFSGGVDSSTLAFLLNKSIGDQLCSCSSSRIDSLNPAAMIPTGIPTTAIPPRAVRLATIFPAAVWGTTSP